MLSPKEDVLLVSSHVVAGSVGNRAMSFALERLGHAVWAVPTLTLTHHPGRGPARPIVALDADFASLCADLADLPELERIGGVVTGYFASPAQVEAAAALVAAVKAANPDALYLCDPVIGDVGEGGGGRLYVASGIAEAVRDRLLPIADIATPNRFECAWLAGAPRDLAGPATEQARALGPGIVAVTSHPALIAGQTGNLITAGGETLLAEHRRVETAVKGTGDLFAALLLARLMTGERPAEALEAATNAVFGVIVAAEHLGAAELPLAAAQEAIVHPPRRASLRRLAATARPAATRSTPAGEPAWVAGVDGCAAGWIAVFRDAAGQNPPRLRCFGRFADILDAPEAPRRIAVDMPIGLPERIRGAGRAAEQAVKPLLKHRQSSVFTIPARKAVFAEGGPFADQPDLYRAHRRASAVARALSDPPRAVSIQAFMIFPKIRELDALMTPALAERVFETHPEVAFWRLNGEAAMETPKKIDGRPNPGGIAQRRALLAGHGYDPAFLAQDPPRGAGPDDLIDAAVNAVVAERLLAGAARPFPDPPERDARGLPIAIWA